MQCMIFHHHLVLPQGTFVNEYIFVVVNLSLRALLAEGHVRVYKYYVGLGGAKDKWEKQKVRNLMGALLIPILLVLGCSEQFSKLS